MDLPARYGGEEFAVILPHTEALGAGVVGGRIQRQVAAIAAAAARRRRRRCLRRAMARCSWASGCARTSRSTPRTSCRAAAVTVSIGVASLSAGELPCDELVHRADKALYVAKRAGKNRVEVYS